MRVRIRVSVELWAGGIFVEVHGRFLEPAHSFLEYSTGDSRQFKINVSEDELKAYIRETKQKILEELKARKEQHDRAKALERKYSIAEEYLI